MYVKDKDCVGECRTPVSVTYKCWYCRLRGREAWSLQGRGPGALGGSSWSAGALRCCPNGRTCTALQPAVQGPGNTATHGFGAERAECRRQMTTGRAQRTPCSATAALSAAPAPAPTPAPMPPPARLTTPAHTPTRPAFLHPFLLHLLLLLLLPLLAAAGCLKDLQRFLRRDDPELRPVFMRLGEWRIAAQVGQRELGGGQCTRGGVVGAAWGRNEAGELGRKMRFWVEDGPIGDRLGTADAAPPLSNGTRSNRRFCFVPARVSWARWKHPPSTHLPPTLTPPPTPGPCLLPPALLPPPLQDLVPLLVTYPHDKDVTLQTGGGGGGGVPRVGRNWREQPGSLSWVLPGSHIRYCGIQTNAPLLPSLSSLSPSFSLPLSAFPLPLTCSPPAACSQGADLPHHACGVHQRAAGGAGGVRAGRQGGAAAAGVYVCAWGGGGGGGTFGRGEADVWGLARDGGERAPQWRGCGMAGRRPMCCTRT